MKSNTLNLCKEDIERIKSIRPLLRERRILDLNRYYTVNKERYFGKTIPSIDHVSIILVAEKTMEKMYGPVYENGKIYGICFQNLRLSDVCVDAPAMICLSEGIGNSPTIMNLIHEMAHLKIDRMWKQNMGHGKHWQNEMKRLSKLGAFDPYW